MPDSAKRGREFRVFKFRRRYDHFLRFRLSGANPDEVIDVARDLGFNLNLKDLPQKKRPKPQLSKKITFFSRLRSFLLLDAWEYWVIVNLCNCFSWLIYAFLLFDLVCLHWHYRGLIIWLLLIPFDCAGITFDVFKNLLSDLGCCTWFFYSDLLGLLNYGIVGLQCMFFEKVTGFS